MKLIELLEAFETGGKRGRDYFEIFSNPTKKEMLIAHNQGTMKGVRFIVDTLDQKLYVFSADIIHAWAADWLNIKYTTEGEERYIFGGRGTVQKSGKIKLARFGGFGSKEERARFDEEMQKGWLGRFFV